MGRTKYEVWELLCRNKGHEEKMMYEGDGNYVCPVCGDVYHDPDYDDDGDDSESLSVYDAADIWLSNGKDEDYTFGYSVEELERALR